MQDIVIPSFLLAGPPRPEDDDAWQTLLHETQTAIEGRPGKATGVEQKQPSMLPTTPS